MHNSDPVQHSLPSRQLARCVSDLLIILGARLHSDLDLRLERQVFKSELAMTMTQMVTVFEYLSERRSEILIKNHESERAHIYHNCNLVSLLQYTLLCCIQVGTVVIYDAVYVYYLIVSCLKKFKHKQMTGMYIPINLLL